MRSVPGGAGWCRGCIPGDVEPGRIAGPARDADALAIRSATCLSLPQDRLAAPSDRTSAVAPADHAQARLITAVARLYELADPMHTVRHTACSIMPRAGHRRCSGSRPEEDGVPYPYT